MKDTKKRKVLIVNKFLYPNGGSETYVFEIGKQLEKMGHAVEYFGMEHKDRIVGNRVNSYTASMDFHSGAIGRLIYPFKIIYSREARKKIHRVLEDFKPDIIHLNNFNFQITPSIIYEIRKWEKINQKRVAIVYTAHDYQWVCPNHLMLIPESREKCFRCKGGKFIQCTRNKCIHNSKIKSLLGTLEAELYRILKTYQKVDRIICPSQFMKRQLETNPALKGKLVTLHNFLNEEKNPVQEKKDYVLYFGRFSEEKGINTLIQVCKMLPEIPFVFAGAGPEEERLSECSNITNAGFLKGNEMKSTIASARFSILPSECFENCPFSVMEALNYGTPVIASNVGGVPELLREGVAGELFEAGDVNQLAEKVENLWNHKELCRKYTSNCQSVKFDTIEEYCEKLLNIYEAAWNSK